MLSASLGTVIWTSIAFLAVIFLLGKMAWKPILKSIQDRESSIEDALKAAEEAKKEVANLKADNDKIISEARAERDAMLKDARETKDRIVSEAKGQAKTEADKIIADARESIHNEKMAAITELKNQVASLSIEMAEKILKSELGSEDKQKAMLDNVLKDVNLN